MLAVRERERCPARRNSFGPLARSLPKLEEQLTWFKSVIYERWQTVKEKERKSTAELPSQLCTESSESSLESEVPTEGGKRPQSKPTQ